MLSILADPVEHTTLMRKQKDGTSINITCHQAVQVYNQFMGGVDKGDQLREYYKVCLKSTKKLKVHFLVWTRATSLGGITKYA